MVLVSWFYNFVLMPWSTLQKQVLAYVTWSRKCFLFYVYYNNYLRPINIPHPSTQYSKVEVTLATFSLRSSILWWISEQSECPNNFTIGLFEKKLAVELKCPILDAFINRLPVPLLTCLCAQSVRVHRTPYDDKKLPSVLVSILKNHGAE